MRNSGIKSPAQDEAEENLKMSTNRFALGKREREVDRNQASEDITKRLKPNTKFNHHTSQKGDAVLQRNKTNTAPEPRLMCGTSHSLPPEVQALHTKYDCSTMSIISSSKIEQKVRNLLLRIGKLTSDETKAKPGVVILHAKAKVASKMVSMVEIAKQAIENEKGTWWQYSKLDGEVGELKRKQGRRVGGGKALSEREKEHSGPRTTASSVRVFSEDTGMADISTDGQNEEEAVSEDDETDEVFETMDHHNPADSDKLSTRVKRNTPVMTVYFARIPIPGLKRLYGYVRYLPVHTSIADGLKQRTNKCLNPRALN